MLLARAKNMATAEQVVRVFKRRWGSGFTESNYQISNLDAVVENCRSVLLDLLALTPRLNTSLLEEAAVNTWRHITKDMH